MLDAINTWLNSGCNYQEGVGLYDQYGDNNFLKLIFKNGETPVNRQKLNEQLAALRDAAPRPQPVASPSDTPAPIIKTVPQPVTQPVEKPAELPALLQVTHQRDQNYAEIRALHPYLKIKQEGDELRQIALRIVRLGKKNAELWERYNYMTETGIDPDAPAPPAPPVMVDINLINKKEAVRKSLSRAEKRIEGQAKPNAKTLELINAQRLKLAELNELIARAKKGGNL